MDGIQQRQHFAVDTMFDPLSDHHLSSHSQHVHNDYDHSPTTWPHLQSMPATPIDSSHMYSTVLNSHPGSHASYPPAAAGFAHYSPNQPSPQTDYPHQQYSEPSFAMNLTGPPISSALGPERALPRRRAAQVEAAPYDVNRQAYEPSGQAYASGTLSNSRSNSPDGVVSPTDFRSGPDFSLQNNAGAHEPARKITRTPGSSSPQRPPPKARSRNTPYTRRNKNSTNGKNPRPASPALSATSALTSLSSGSNGQPAAQDDVTPAPPPGGTKHKGRLFSTDRRDICIFARDNPNVRQEDIARMWGVERSTISKILKHKAKWLNVKADETLRIAKERISKFPEIETSLRFWLEDCHEKKLLISDAMIRDKAREIADLNMIGTDKFKASPGWVENFKQRYGVKGGVWHGDGTKGKKLAAVGDAFAIGEGAVQEYPNQEEGQVVFGPSLGDIIRREGYYDVDAAINYQIPDDSPFLYDAEDIMRMTDSKDAFEAIDKVRKYRREHNSPAPWDRVKPFAQVMLDEESIEKQAVAMAEHEARKLAREARDAGDEFNFHDTFLRLVKDAMRSLPEVDKHGRPYPIRPPESHPDDLPDTQGASGADALASIFKVLSFVHARQPDFIPLGHLQVLYDVWHSIVIVNDRDRRRLYRIGQVEEIAKSDPFCEPISSRPLHWDSPPPLTSAPSSSQSGPSRS